MHSSTGEYLGYVGTLEDIASRVLTESNLRSESAFRVAIEESIPSGIAAINGDGRQTYVNRAFADMVGYTAEEQICARAPFIYWPAEEIRRIQDAFTEKLQGCAPRHGFELRFRRKIGRVLQRAGKLGEEAGKRSGWVASVTARASHDRKCIAHERGLPCGV